MNVTETTERYEFKTSNLKHSYYAVNSVDGRMKTKFIAEEFSAWPWLSQNISAVYQWLAKVFQANFNLALPLQKDSLLPGAFSISVFGNQLNSPITIPLSTHHANKKGHHPFNTTTNK